MYYYYVSFFTPDGVAGSEFTTDVKIKCFEDVRRLRACLMEQNGLSDVVIINWRRLSSGEQNPPAPLVDLDGNVRGDA